MAGNFRFIMALTRHRFLGELLLPYIVEEQPAVLLVKGVVAPGTADEQGLSLTPRQREMVRLAAKCTPVQLARKFSRETTAADFFVPANDEIIRKSILPWVGKQMYRIALLLMDGHTPLYGKDPQYSRIYKEDRLEVPGGFCRPQFHFRRTTEGTAYRLRIFSGSGEIPLTGRDFRVISQAPCVMACHQRLLIFEKLEALKIKPFTTREVIHIPPPLEQKYYTSFIAPLLRDYEVLADGFSVSETHVVPRPLLSLEHDLASAPAILLKFRYGEELFPAVMKTRRAVTLESLHGEYRFLRLTRNAEVEQKPSDFLLSLGLKYKQGFYTLPGLDLLQIEEATALLVDWISRHSPELEKEGFEISTTGLGKNYFTGKREMVFDVGPQTDWFDVYAVVQIGDFRIPFLRLRKYLLSGIREFELPDGRVAILPEEWFARYRYLIPFARGTGSRFTLQRHHFPLLASLDSGATALHTIGEAFRTMERIPLPEGLRAELRGYQVTGYRWMVTLMNNRLGGCLSDDMGLGKTLQAIALLLKIRKRRKPVQNLPSCSFPLPGSGGRQLSLFDEPEAPPSLPAQHRPTATPGTTAGPVAAAGLPAIGDIGAGGGPRDLPGTSLVVMPASLVHNWLAEFRRFAPSLRVYSHTGAQRNRLPDPRNKLLDYDVVLTTYGTLRNDYPLFADTLFRCLILDESQYVKNPSSKSYKAVMALHAIQRFVLTGTPVENSLSDLWAQVNFLNPGLLGSFLFFRHHFLLPAETRGDAEASAKLLEMVRPFILRRTKAEVASDLPPLMEQTIVCSMTGEQRSLYEKEKSLIRNSILANIEARGMERSSLFILQGMTRLRQIAIHPGLLRDTEPAGSGKFNEIMESLMSLVAEKHKVLIFSSFVTHLELIRQGVAAAGLRYSLLTGKTRDRGEVIRTFQEDPQNYIFLISMKAGGVGLNLTSAEYVFIVDPWWNPAVEEQALSRAHRIGQVKNTFVYRFITGETIEEKIGILKARKKALADRFINRNNPLGALTRDDLMDLIG